MLAAKKILGASLDESETYWWNELTFDTYADIGAHCIDIDEDDEIYLLSNDRSAVPYKAVMVAVDNDGAILWDHDYIRGSTQQTVAGVKAEPSGGTQVFFVSEPQLICEINKSNGAGESGCTLPQEDMSGGNSGYPAVDGSGNVFQVRSDLKSGTGYGVACTKVNSSMVEQANYLMVDTSNNGTSWLNQVGMGQHRDGSEIFIAEHARNSSSKLEVILGKINQSTCQATSSVGIDSSVPASRDVRFNDVCADADDDVYILVLETPSSGTSSKSIHIVHYSSALSKTADKRYDGNAANDYFGNNGALVADDTHLYALLYYWDDDDTPDRRTKLLKILKSDLSIVDEMDFEHSGGDGHDAGQSLVEKGDNLYLAFAIAKAGGRTIQQIKYPKDFSITGTFGSLTITSTSNISAATSSISTHSSKTTVAHAITESSQTITRTSYAVSRTHTEIS